MHGCFETMKMLSVGDELMNIQLLGFPDQTVDSKRSVYFFNGDLICKGDSGIKLSLHIPNSGPDDYLR